MRSLHCFVYIAVSSAAIVAPRVVEAQDDGAYKDLASQLAQSFPEVGQRSTRYLANAIVPGPIKAAPSADIAADMATYSFQDSGPRGGRPPRIQRAMPIQKDIILLHLRPGVSIDKVNALLDKYQLKVLSGVPEIGLLIVEVGRKTPAIAAARADEAALRPTADINGLTETIRALRAERDVVATAATNTLLTPLNLPRPTQGAGKDRSGNTHFWDWREGAGTPAAAGRDGNYGQKLVRFPAAWNFSDAIKARGKSDVHVGVLDVGFNNHEDLSFTNSPVTPTQVDDHGNHVMGIIAASSGNAVGVNGGTPFAKVTACSVHSNTLTNPSSIPAIYPILSEVIASLVEFTASEPDLKAVNISLGYNWVPNLNRNPNTDTELQELVESHGIIMRSLANLLASRGIIIVSAAGNDSDAGSGFPGVKAVWGSPFNWAAFNNGISNGPATNVIVVESVDRLRAISPFSNVEGCVSAPGQAILSAVAYNELGLPSTNGYAVFNGTSMAAPQVTALVALIYAYNPSLSMDAVLDILNVRSANRPAAITPAPTIDAFDALVASRDRSLKDLADLNGDDKVDMADFQIFRDALRQVEGTPGVTPKDLNGDGVVSPSAAFPTAPSEDIFPRADLNGSGKLSRAASDKRRVKGEELGDLEVMMKVWEDPTVPAAMLPGML